MVAVGGIFGSLLGGINSDKFKEAVKNDATVTL